MAKHKYTVRDLIGQLTQLPPDAEIILCDAHGTQQRAVDLGDVCIVVTAASVGTTTVMFSDWGKTMTRRLAHEQAKARLSFSRGGIVQPGMYLVDETRRQR